VKGDISSLGPISDAIRKAGVARRRAKAKEPKPLTVELQNVGRALYTSDACPATISKRDCEDVASYILKTMLGLRAKMDGRVTVDLGKAGLIDITHRGHDV
jgi:hypothetical protein